MRTGQNKRMRGRNNNNNNRKGPNPLTRSYESNGPDVKIRGTPHHVAEKYLQLARDAQTSGDPVMAESYLQHAEHYFRIIAVAQQQQLQAQAGYVRPAGEPDQDEGDDDDDVGGLPDRFASPVERQPVPQFIQPQAQPAIAPQPQPYQNRPQFNGERSNQERQGQERFNQDRPPRQERPQYQDRNDRDNRQERQGREFRNRDQYRGPRDQQGQPQAEKEGRAPATEQPEGGPILPAFITAPVRVNPAADTEIIRSEAQPGPDQTSQNNDDSDQFHLRSRRRRRERPVAESGDTTADNLAPTGTPAAD